jgi:hypothetical protein
VHELTSADPSNFVIQSQIAPIAGRRIGFPARDFIFSIHSKRFAKWRQVGRTRYV